MRNTTFFIILSLFSNIALCNSLSIELDNIESDWAISQYRQTEQQHASFSKLIERCKALRKQYPSSAELKIWHAILLASDAPHESPLFALASLSEAREFLKSTISSNPNALDGAAQVTLGTLYFKVPSWPLSFGNQKQAQILLEEALTINPESIESIESNYYYAEY